MDEDEHANSKSAPPRGPAALLRRAGAVIDGFEVYSLCVGISLLAIFLIANVIARMVWQSIYFIEEVSEFLIIFITFVGLSYGARQARHIRMGAFLDLAPDIVEKGMIFIISSISSAVMFLMSWHAWQYMLHVKAVEQTTSALRAPYWVFLVIIPIGFFAAGVQYLRTFIKNCREKEVWLSSDRQSEYEEGAP